MPSLGPWWWGRSLLRTPAKGSGASSSSLPQHPEGGTCKDNSSCTPGKAERKAQGKVSLLPPASTAPSRLSPPGSPFCLLPSCHLELGWPCPRPSHISVLRLLLLGVPQMGTPRSRIWGASPAPPAWGGHPGVSPSLQASAQASAWLSTTLCRRVRSSAGAPWKWMTMSHGNSLSCQGAGSKVPKPRQRDIWICALERIRPCLLAAPPSPHLCSPGQRFPQPLVEGPESPLEHSWGRGWRTFPGPRPQGNPIGSPPPHTHTVLISGGAHGGRGLLGRGRE